MQKNYIISSNNLLLFWLSNKCQTKNIYFEVIKNHKQWPIDTICGVTLNKVSMEFILISHVHFNMS